MVGRSDCQFLLALEMMKEAAFGEPCGLANILDTRRRVALGTYHLERCVQELFL
jgi:hypothetical protein